ncbi:uncharacterized protein LOC134278223 [Saccostrea cucullata]|uniref:uncharacterized protein LOC134278223 n=1 Tax=Saccostrea cuccullata TaxID=36930 RepID=UPI002ED1A34D
MDNLPRLSEFVYVGMCREIGSPTEVRIRREVMDTDEVMNRPVYIMRGFDRIMSGSSREGFRMRTSDLDWMLWPPDHKVICDLSQINLYRIPQHTVILMECDDLPPGFTKLNLIIKLLAYVSTIMDTEMFRKGLAKPEFCITQMERMIRGRLIFYQPVIIQCITSNVLRNTAMYLQSCRYKNGTRNKVYYKAKVDTLLKQTYKFGFLSDILYLAMNFYRTRRYEDSLKCLHKAEGRISLPYIIYGCHVNVDMYRHHMERKTLGTKMRRAVVKNIKLDSLYSYIDELVIEQEVSKKQCMYLLQIPPLVMLNMLFTLNHHRLGDTVRSQRSLQDLQALLLYDDGTHIPLYPRDISWQILGICQQICGDYSGSLQSYRYSLQQIPFHKLQEATLIRIHSLPSDAI